MNQIEFISIDLDRTKGEYVFIQKKRALQLHEKQNYQLKRSSRTMKAKRHSQPNPPGEPDAYGCVTQMGQGRTEHYHVIPLPALVRPRPSRKRECHYTGSNTFDKK